MTTPTTKSSAAQRLQDGVLVLIVLLVGVMAGAASFTHVHDWTMHNSPTATGDWFGWANAVISELIPTAALIIITRRRRTGAPIGYPMFLLIIAVALSLTAQLAVAQPTVFGWMVSALPALAFFALSKLIFTATPAARPTPVPAPTPATSPAPSIPDTASATPTPAATTPADTPPVEHAENPAVASPAKQTRAPAPAMTVPAAPAPAPAPAPAARPAAAVATIPTVLLANARTIATAHRDQHGEPITAGQLAVRLKVPTTVATDILTVLHTTPTTPDTYRPHNGSPVGAPA